MNKEDDTEVSAMNAWVTSLESEQPVQYETTAKPIPDQGGHIQTPVNK